MDSVSAIELDAHLCAGGIVVAASDRAARAVRAAFHRARRDEGLSAWPAPRVLDWKGFVRAEWGSRIRDGRLVLNTNQEQSLWFRIVSESEHTAGWLEAPRRRLASLAMEAHDLLCAYAPRLLAVAARRTWQQDAAAFSRWLATFDELSDTDGLLSESRLPLELLPLLENNENDPERDPTGRAPLILAGFDRLLPIQQRVFEAWGECHLVAPDAPATDLHFYAAPNEQLELAACALWCNQQLAENPTARLMIVTQDASKRRGEIERTFLKHAGNDLLARFEFSLGVPLSQVELARAASLLLRWLDQPLREHELDWLLASGTAVASPEETRALQSYMRVLRRRGLERARWTLEAFLRQPVAPSRAQITWVQRMSSAQQRLKKASARAQSPLDWSALAAQLLEATAWPGPRQLTSAEFQVVRRWQQALDLCGSLGFDGRHIRWHEFLSELDRTLSDTLFAQESQDAPVVIAGPAESAGLTADAIWFLGADENAWPASGSAHPLLPLEVQRAASMPHSTAPLDWNLAESITARLVASAPRISFSYARQKEDVEARPSRLAKQFAGTPEPLPDALLPEPANPPITIPIEDTTRIPLTIAPISKQTAQLSLFDPARPQPEAPQTREIAGGSNVLTSQSQCAFKAFATARLGARPWEPAQSGLTAAQRGQLLHAVLHSVWSEPPQGIRTFDQLNNLGADLRSFVEDHVCRVLAEEMPAGAREQMPVRYLELEQQRLTSLVTEWLEYERTRTPFTVEATEIDTTATIAGLAFKLRLDRVDRLSDSSLLVVDYKSGNVSPKSWELPRPDDVQLPLYAGFALPAGDDLGGLVFAKVRPGDMCFTGKVANAAATIDSRLNGTSGLVKNPLTPEQLAQWKNEIEQLAKDFLAGRADVDPRDYPATCERCGLYTLCRVRERSDEFTDSADEDQSEAGDD